MNGLNLANITHAYDDFTVVRDVSISVEPGELTCLLGPSGCGKTTLLRLAAGLEIVQQGNITIGDRLVGDGESRRHLPPEARGVGLMFQDYALFPHLTIFENIAFGIPDGAPDRLDWVHDSLARVGLSSYAEHYPHTLSGGQQQRVALLRALAPEPRVLLLDEPFSGMDVTLRSTVREETLGILKDTGVATLMVTHDPEEAMFMADQILVMEGGRIVQAGPPVETYFKPVSAFVAALFGPVNQLQGTVKSGAVETTLGSFSCSGIEDGTAVHIFIRPEGLNVARRGESLPEGVTPNAATVISARLLGRSTHLRLLCTGSGTANGDELKVRVPGVYMPDENAEVSVWVDPRQVFIFPAE